MAIIIFLSLILIAVLTQVYFILREKNQLKDSLENLNRRLETLLKENDNLQSEIEYFSHSENLEKELRARFNYKKLGEKMMIIVP